MLQSVQVVQHEPVERYKVSDFGFGGPARSAFRVARSTVVNCQPGVGIFLGLDSVLPEIESSHDKSSDKQLMADEINNRVVVRPS